VVLPIVQALLGQLTHRGQLEQNGNRDFRRSASISLSVQAQSSTMWSRTLAIAGFSLNRGADCVPKPSSLFPEDYGKFLSDLKHRIRQAQIKASLAVNAEMITLYWEIGREILNRQQQQGYGAKVVEQLAKDLKQEFTGMTGFSARNLKYMRTFAEAYPDPEVVQRSVAQLPWRHNIALLEKLKSIEERLWYAQKAVENGWSRDILAMQIETRLLERQGSAITNFERTMPQIDSDLATQLLKDPYNFNFLSLTQAAQERELEKALVVHIRNFLLELGVGFAFLGSQYLLVVDNKDYFIDMLFYHVKLHCYVVIELKVGEFNPASSGQLNFYVSAVDNLLRSPEDGRTIGLILCRSKSDLTVEYALQDIHKPIGVATYLLKEDLPEPLKASLPSIAQLETQLQIAAAEIEGQEADERAE
jgi:predicted nuclease of restriction endonuclease-like (RecB) superfamily